MELSPSWEAANCAATQEINPAFYGTRWFITVFTRALHRSLFWARSIQSLPSDPISLRSILILSTHLLLGLPNIYIKLLHASTLLGHPQATLVERNPSALRHWFFTHCIFILCFCSFSLQYVIHYLLLWFSSILGFPIIMWLMCTYVFFGWAVRLTVCSLCVACALVLCVVVII
jgi:hypothetical protein